MGISITQTYARIGVDRTPSNLEIYSQRAKLELHQKHAKIHIETELPRVEIDQYEAFASSGLKNFLDLTKEGAQLGMQSAMSYIGKVAADGDTLAAIETKSDPIPGFAIRDSYTEHEFDIASMPKTGPRINVTGSINIQAERNAEGVNNGVEGTFIPQNIEINFVPSQVSVYLRQYASIEIQYQGNNVDVSI